MLHDGKIMEWEQRCEWILEYWKETRPIKICNRNDASPSVGDLVSQEDTYKLFTDAAVNNQTHGMGYGMVVMGPKDTIVATMEMVEPSSFSPLAAEI